MSLEIPLSQLSSPLSLNEQSGVMSGSIGMVGRRAHQLPSDWPSPVSRFLAPAHGSPKPSARRPAPRREYPPMRAA